MQNSRILFHNNSLPALSLNKFSSAKFIFRNCTYLHDVDLSRPMILIYISHKTTKCIDVIDGAERATHDPEIVTKLSLYYRNIVICNVKYTLTSRLARWNRKLIFCNKLLMYRKHETCKTNANNGNKLLYFQRPELWIIVMFV